MEAGEAGVTVDSLGTNISASCLCMTVARHAWEPVQSSSWPLEHTSTGETLEPDLVCAGKARIRDPVKDKNRRTKCDACHKTRRTVCWGGNTKKIIMIYCGKRKQPYKPKAVACSNCRQVKSKCDGDQPCSKCSKGDKFCEYPTAKDQRDVSEHDGLEEL